MAFQSNLAGRSMRHHRRLATALAMTSQLKRALSLCGGVSNKPRVVILSENTWRHAASRHSERMRNLLAPGLTPPDHPINAGAQRQRNQRRKRDGWTALDPVNPVYNFLIEYYGLKGAKGPRRLARWSPDPALLSRVDDSEHDGPEISPEVRSAALKASANLGGVLLEKAKLDDLGDTLHLRGGVPVPTGTTEDGELYGILYNPAVFYHGQFGTSIEEQQQRKEGNPHRDEQLRKTMAPFQWYQSILATTLRSDPVLHCYGLHEWAMQYHPDGADPPPSSKYQSTLPLRVSRQVINDTVERKGIRCTHVDALRFFAPAAGPLNYHGATLERTDQLRLEQKGCVHAHMDLLKIGLKLGSFVNPDLMCDIIETALEARRLDVEASPYDATGYGCDVVAIETSEGRRTYRDRQIALMDRAEPVRRRLLSAYDVFLSLAFGEEGRSGYDSNPVGMHREGDYAAPERFARAEPGGEPWRRNLIER